MSYVDTEIDLPHREPFVGPPLPMELSSFEPLPVDQLERLADALRAWDGVTR